MDIARPDLKRRKQRRRLLAVGIGIGALALVTLGLSRLEPAAPRLDRGQVWTDTVKRGEMLRQVRGNGALVPEQIQYVQSDTDGRIERILALAGAEVEADTLLMVLSNPELEQQSFDLEWQVKAAEANFRKLLVQLESDRLTQESGIATLRAEHTLALLEAEADDVLARDGLVPELLVRRSRARADELKQRLEVEMRRLAIQGESVEAQRAAFEADLAKLRASRELKRQQVAALHVKAGIAGVLQQIGDREMLQVGQRIGPGATLAKIVQPHRLKAEIKIPETQARDVQIGQRAQVDTRNGVIPGRVSRVDPAVIGGTVTVDVVLEGPLPRGARPDLSVDGTIELERLEDVLYVGRPIHAQPDGMLGLFRVGEDGRTATRVPVRLGRSSVTTIEVVEGLREGDQIILTDMSSWDDHERVRLN